VNDNIASGMAPEEARRQAILEFGGREQIKEELRDVHGIPILEALAMNLRFAWRLIRKSPVFSVVVVLPAFRGTRRGIAGSLANSSRTQVSGRNPVQWVLVGVQVALAVTLLVGAGLLQRSLAELARVSPGFDPSQVLTLHISISYGETAHMKALAQRTNRMLDAFRALPGIEAAAAVSTLPGIPGQQQTELRILEGEQDPNRKIIADSRFVSTGYFGAMHIPVLAGEPCKEQPNSMPVIVNRSFANTYFGQGPSIGHHLTTAASSQFLLMGEIQGIVGDAREQGLNSEPCQPCIGAAMLHFRVLTSWFALAANRGHLLTRCDARFTRLSRAAPSSTSSR
jgi:putative ABC transport system permease protein